MHWNVYVHNCCYTHNCRCLECIKLWPCGFLIAVQIFIPSWKHTDALSLSLWECACVWNELSLYVFLWVCVCADCNKFSPFGHTVPHHSNLHPSFPLFAQRPPHTHITHTHREHVSYTYTRLSSLSITHLLMLTSNTRQSWSFMQTDSSPKNTHTHTNWHWQFDFISVQTSRLSRRLLSLFNWN